MLNATLWKLFRSGWSPPPAARVPGYTVLLAVPADLPVFLRIAMGTINAQRNDGLVETLVIPDMPTPAFEAEFERAKQSWTNGPIRLVRLRALERFVTRRINSPHTNHWLQLVNGLDHCTSTHALLHDADLFITDTGFLSSHYAAASAPGAGLACMGINPVWDAWYRENGLGHVTATWELMMDVDWARSFKAWQHRGHNGVVAGKAHEFDTMLLPQSLTDPARVARHQGEWGFVHFNYVICTYRWFAEAVRAGKGPYADDHFRILLIRLLADAYGSTETEAQLPLLPEIERGLGATPGRVVYRGEAAAKNYGEFREKLRQLIESGILDERQVAILRDGVAKFDARFQPDAPAAREATEVPAAAPIR